MKEFVYPGSVFELEKILLNHSSKKIFLVTGKQSYVKCGAQKLFSKILSNHNVTKFDDFCVNPKLDEMQLGLKKLIESKSELIIAVGGGSVIDAAKVIKYLFIKSNSQDQFNDSLPLLAIPTTAGTGSESTHFAVVYINGVKNSYSDKSILPDFAIVDSNLLQGQSKYQMAVSGFDALSQGIESYWSINSDKESLNYAKRAINLIWQNLIPAIAGDKIALERIAEGSNYAGKAINITKTTGAHALSYFFTEKYNIPHGHSVAIFLPSFFSYNYMVEDNNCIDKRGSMFVKKKISEITNLLGLNSPELVELELKKFLNKIGINASFEALNISYDMVVESLKMANLERMKNNPRLFLKEDFLRFL
mgnify:CR=1 FL=1